jgi:protein-tyrosine phosphatase
MPTFTWWIDDPLIKGSGNPTDDDLLKLYTQGFRHAVCLLEEDKQLPRYDKHSAETMGWFFYAMPIEEGCAPSLDQVCEFKARLTALRSGTKVLVFCESGVGRTAFMGAVYWVMKGLTASEAITRVSEATSATDWLTADRNRVLSEYEKLQRGAG